MKITYPSQCLFLLLLLLALAVSGCTETPMRLSAQSQQAINFSGDWELNYAQSDQLQARLNSTFRELRKKAERSRPPVSDRAGPQINLATSSHDADSLIALARMADLITQSPLLHIKQDEQGILVKREANFALDCQFVGEQAYRLDSALGRERCGWLGHQLAFTLLLPEGLSIRHLLTLSSDRQQLNIATTLVSDQVSMPFTLNRVYQRFDPGSRGYHCKMTLTKGRVCSTESQ
ncbi:hypothetical protein H2508_02740 [Parahaliea sp. F7430]|uniref:Lipoprotein n=1 Tax=Sediminihaliea albiluteola TaxID=2758564 RepID=A0A7W2YIF9_9GAMM|nr:hypothetical protein [Sediminihaliea albiluteola]MBA6412025.1 hypothetical protein [Sediminihaliea albiluteola]